MGGDIPGRVVITEGPPSGFQVPFTHIVQSSSQDAALINQAIQQQLLFDTGQRQYNLYGTGNNTQCTGFATQMLFGN